MGGGGGDSPFYLNFNISLWFNENKKAVISVQSFTKYSIFIVDVKSGRFMYQSGRAGDEAKKRKSPAKSGRVGITVILSALWFGAVRFSPVLIHNHLLITSTLSFLCS